VRVVPGPVACVRQTHRHGRFGGHKWARERDAGTTAAHHYRAAVPQQYQLAQINVGLPVEPLDSAALAEFVAGLAPVNARADRAPGFVWRLQTEDGDATAIRAFDDERIIVNMSVWESLDALGTFVFRDDGHRSFLRRRRQWFVKLTDAITALWWVPAGHRPTVVEAKERLMHLRAQGPTAYAFTFRAPFAAPDGAAPVATDDDWRCPTG
jgi:hypothetical protein